MEPSPTPGVKQIQPQPQNWYKVLGVRNDASKEEIKLAYRRLASVWRPDRHVDDKNLATTKFAEIDIAYRAIMLERSLTSVYKAREDAINPPPTSPETRPPAVSRPTMSSFGSRRSSSSTTLPSLSFSSRQSSFESVSTPPSTPRFPSRSASKHGEGIYTSYFDRPITLPLRTYAITPPAQSIEVTLSDLIPPTPTTPVTPITPRQFDEPYEMSRIPENNPQESAETECDTQSPPVLPAPPAPPALPALPVETRPSICEITPLITLPSRPQPPRPIRRGESLPKGTPHLSEVGLGTSKEWDYSLLLTLEELFFGKTCRLRITRYLRNGEKTNVVLDVTIPPGTVPGTQFLFKGVGSERPDHTSQDISFVIQQVAHKRFTRVEDDLIMEAKIPHHDKDPRVCYTGIDGSSASVQIDRQEDTVAGTTGNTVVFGAGMPRVDGNEVVGRGNLVIRYDTLSAGPIPAARTHSLTSWTVGPAPLSRWRAFKNILRFKK
ncbi:hypothetical protein AAF712_013026 [Marasmius tenuissimus]|uniref:J domain-containing protein n=1 Tax=Marasmius tenuissimus TaxID=585030 RepID=A0ABR2ZGX2_9AGAR|nr:hypothetical protein PM082_015890 [Marasmius tenuissimus]